MPDPNVTLTAIQSHANALDGAIRRHVANAGRCKVFGAAGVMGVLLLASGRAQMGALPWVAGVVGLLALADACQVVMGRICRDAYNGFMRKLPLNGGNAMKAEECFVLPAPEPGWREVGRVLGALGSFSVLPFYGALLALVVAFYVQSSAGMGTGRGEGERGRLGEKGAAKAVQSGAVKTSVPMTVGPRPTPRVTSLPADAGAQPGPKTMQPGGQGNAPGGRVPPPSMQPGQPPALSPLRPEVSSILRTGLR